MRVWVPGCACERLTLRRASRTCALKGNVDLAKMLSVFLFCRNIMTSPTGSLGQGGGGESSLRHSSAISCNLGSLKSSNVQSSGKCDSPLLSFVEHRDQPDALRAQRKTNGLIVKSL